MSWPTKWRDAYLAIATPDTTWIARNAKRLLHLRDLREAGLDERIDRRIPRSGVRCPGGKRLSKCFVTKRDVAQAIQTDARDAKRARRKASVRS